MFGKPEWFQPKNDGRKLYPKAWQGWLYVLVWIVVMAGPFATLITFGLVPESIIWLLAAGGLFAWDVHLLRRGKQQEQAAPEEIEITDDSEHGESTLDTRDYEMRLRQ